MKVFISLVLGLLISLGAYAQSSASDTFTSSMVLRAAITLSCTNMNFPPRVAGKAYSTALNSDSGQQYAGFGNGNNSNCTVTGYASGKYSIETPGGTNMTRSGGSETIAISSFAVVGGVVSGRSLIGGNDSFQIRGTINSMSARPAGTYVSGNITVSVHYD